MSVIEVLEAVRALSDEERAQVKDLLNTLSPAPQPQMTEDEFEQYLAAKGIATIPDRDADPDLEKEDYEPIIVEGTPLSQIIIEGRGPR